MLSMYDHDSVVHEHTILQPQYTFNEAFITMILFNQVALNEVNECVVSGVADGGAVRSMTAFWFARII